MPIEKKGIVKKKITDATYIIQDVVEMKLYTIAVSGKQRMGLGQDGLTIGQEIHFVCSPYEPEKCRLFTAIDYKMM